MLSRREQASVKRGGFVSWHDVRVQQLVAGEPFLIENMICYFDGRLATICGFPIDRLPLQPPVVIQTAQHWVFSNGAEGVRFTGPEPVRLNALAHLGLRRTLVEPRHATNAELIIDAASSPHDPKRSRWALGLPYELSIQRGGRFSAAHYRLIELFYQERYLNGYLAEFAFALPTLMTATWTFLIEAWQKGSLCAFAVVHKAFEDTLMGVAFIRDPAFKNVSDFLYAHLRDVTRELGAAKINLGQSPSIGHLKFKRRWGAEEVAPPAYSVEWTRGNLAKRTMNTWGARLVRMGS